MAVKSRKVFYFPGYDPKPPRRYREIYRAEAQKQGAISGYDIAVAGRKTGGGQYGWDVSAKIDGIETKTEYEFMTWTDIVKDSMEGSILKSYIVFLVTGWRYFFSGAWGAYKRLGRPPFIVTLYPFLVLGGQLFLAIFAALVVYFLAALVVWKWLAAVKAITVFVGALIYFKSIDHKIYAHYLMYDYGYAVSRQGEYPAELQDRLKDFTDDIIKASKAGFDEVLIVGHSSGANVAISALAAALRSGRMGKGQVNLLTIGHVIPLISYLPKAWEIRRDLQYLSENADIAWIDVTAPTDSVCFALVDPVSTTGVETETRLWPIIISAQFKAAIDPARFAALKKKYFQIHVQYLCAFEHPGLYEYFRITAGPQSLAQHFKGRAHSPQRISTLHSPFQNIAP